MGMLKSLRKYSYRFLRAKYFTYVDMVPEFRHSVKMEPIAKNALKSWDLFDKTLVMKESLRTAVATCTSLDQIRECVVPVLIGSGSDRLGYVAGMITSDGPEHIARNVERLALFTKTLRGMHAFPVFSATDIFNQAVYARLRVDLFRPEAREAEFKEFWRSILKQGQVTDIFMTPRWELSEGATDEHQTAQRLGLAIHFPTEVLVINRPLTA